MYVWAPNRVQTTRTAKPHRPQPEPASGGLTWAFSCQCRHVFVMKVRAAREGDWPATAPARLLRRGVIGPDERQYSAFAARGGAGDREAGPLPPEAALRAHRCGLHGHEILGTDAAAL